MKFRERTGSIVAWCALTGHMQPWWRPLITEAQQLDSSFLTEDEQYRALTGLVTRGWSITHVDHEAGTFTVTK